MNIITASAATLLMVTLAGVADAQIKADPAGNPAVSTSMDLEKQLKDQIAAIERGNRNIANLNDVLRAAVQLRSELPNVAVDTAATPNGAHKTALALACSQAGITLNYGTKYFLDKSIAIVKNKIDELSSTQQMDMLRLQSLENNTNIRSIIGNKR